MKQLRDGGAEFGLLRVGALGSEDSCCLNQP